jgi:NAD(P)-dependent dehydrogenase (short-subunit alcohol dehydrogenase family)
MRRLPGRTVLITGAAGGIGAALAEVFAKAGANLVLTDLDARGLDRLEARYETEGITVWTHVCDVTDRDAVFALAERVNADTGGVDVLINNAGVGHHGKLEDTTLDDWRRLVEVNLFGPLHHVYAFLPSMKARRRGHVVNISSGQAFLRLPTWGAFAAIKAALSVFSDTLYYELRSRGVQVTTVYPHMVNTGFYEPAEDGDSAVHKWSMRLLPYYSDRPETVARVVLRAVQRGQREERTHLINDLGYFMNAVPPLAEATRRVVNWMLR